MSSIGTDIEQISRIEKAIARTPRLIERLFTVDERQYCARQAKPAQHYAARFCAKEAFFKALGLPVAWQEIEVVRDENGAPSFQLSGHAIQLIEQRVVHLSLSHAGDYALAVVIIEEQA